MPQIEWIKIHAETFTGETFRKIRRVRAQGELNRDRLTAVFFELLVLAGQCNQSGQLRRQNGEPYADAEDIALMLDRDTEEIEPCINWFLQDGILTYTDGVYTVTNWERFQNEEALTKIRERNKARQDKFRNKKKKEEEESTCNVTECDSNVTDCDSNVTECYSSYSLSPSPSDSYSLSDSYSPSDSYSESFSFSESYSPSDSESLSADSLSVCEKANCFGEYGWVVLTDRQYSRLLADLGAEELQRCIDYIDGQAQSTGNRNGWKDWNLLVRRCHREGWGPKPTARREDGNPFFDFDTDMEVMA